MPTFWTSRAWSDSHSDLFIRNIYTGLDGDDSAHREWAEFEANNARPTWPTLDEVMRWANQNSAANGPVGQVAGLKAEDYQLALDAAIEDHAERCHLNVRPVDANGAVDPDGDPVLIPAKVKLATIIQATSWAGRAKTPNGIAGASEIGGILRVSAYDPTAEKLLAGHLHLGIA